MTSYNVKIDFDGASWSEDLQAAFVATADYISSVILSDVSDIYADVNDGMGPRWFDDLEISTQIVSIDGVGGVLANAGPTYYRTAELIPFAGQMNFDSADAQRLYDADVTNGTNKWYDTVLHEMIHVLGFGTMWKLQGLIANYGTAQAPDYRYTGTLGNQAYATEFPALYAADTQSGLGVPVESDTGSAGTDGGHWDEVTFDTELMTGFIDTTNSVSAMTLASLADLGYDVSYTLSSPPCFCAGTLIDTVDGAVPVEDLRSGCLIPTADHGIQTLRFVLMTRISSENRPIDPKHYPIRFRTGAFGLARQTQDLWVSPQHRMAVTAPNMMQMIGQNTVLIAAKDLLDLQKVQRRVPKHDILYFHLVFDHHVLIRAHGVWSESMYLQSQPPACAFVHGQSARTLVRKLRKAQKQQPFDMNNPTNFTQQTAQTA